VNHKQTIRMLAIRYAMRRYGLTTHFPAVVYAGLTRWDIIRYGRRWVDEHRALPTGVHRCGAVTVDFDRLRTDPAYPEHAKRHDLSPSSPPTR
jgi:hypothetical protein